jgi:hypothetical protein
LEIAEMGRTYRGDEKKNKLKKYQEFRKTRKKREVQEEVRPKSREEGEVGRND